MTPEEFEVKIREILEDTSNIGVVSIALSDLSDAFSEIFAKAKELEDAVKEKDAKINDLREANMALYLKQSTLVENSKDETSVEEEKKREYNELFDDDGNLK